MLEFVGSGLFGGLMGGLFRLAPEVLKFWDRHSERKHELAMFQEQISLEKVKGSFKVEEKYVDYGTAQLNAISEAYKQQAESDSKAYTWVASISSLVRPGITFALFGLYVLFKLTMVYNGTSGDVPWNQVVTTMWGPEDWGMLNMILSFWFVGRSLEKYQHKV
jgi:hypothetical protein